MINNSLGTIFVGCLAHRHTGGLTLAHQLCFELVRQGYDAKMLYYYGYGQERRDPVNEHYKKYNLDYVTVFDDVEENVVIAPETHVNLLRKVRKARKVIWWMSVDNYFKSLDSRRYMVEDLLGLRRYDIKRKDVTHFAQSYYAIDFLRRQGVPADRIEYLSDYLDPEFLENAKLYETAKKDDIVLYNPKKGFEFTRLLMAASPDLSWVALENMTPSEMKERLGTSKVYIDFGNHPGKDRIPREAAIMGCCIITGKRGSANFEQDVKVPSKFKFEDKEDNVAPILEMIRTCLSDYESCRPEFDGYREMIKGEHDAFQNNISDIFASMH